MDILKFMHGTPSFLLIFIWFCTFIALGLFTVRSLESSREHSVYAVEPCITPTPSPTATPTPTPSPSPTPSTTPVSNVYLTEFMACPASGNEWLELYNGNTSEITVTNWQIVDETGNKKYLNGTIAANSFQQFEWTGSLLNNSGDSFTVITASGQTISTASYDSCTTGVSFVYESGEWVGALDSPGEETELSTASIPNSTAAALLKSSITDTSSISSSSAVPNNSQKLAVTTSDVSPLPYNMPILSISDTHSPPALSFIPSTSNSLPVISVIMGGLFQLLPSSIALYGNTKKYLT